MVRQFSGHTRKASEVVAKMENMEHPKTVGDRSMLAIMLALQEAGYAIYLPFGENTRSDLIIDDGAELGRVQCKSGRLRAGAVQFATCSSYAHHPNPRITRRDYLGEIDYFAVYCRQTGGVYLVPIQAVPLRRQASLRVDPARNCQRRRIRLAADYEVGRIPIGSPRECPPTQAVLKE
jgi:hypothetical protein